VLVSLVQRAIDQQFTGTEPGVVAGYMPTGGEIDPTPALAALREHGWSTVLPVCGVDAAMEFHPWKPGDELETNRYGIPEPVSAPIELRSVDVVLVPGVGFDRNGSRIGHGVGYYDRYFARCFAALHDPVRLGLAHDLQIVDLPAAKPWDVAMHMVISPSTVVNNEDPHPI